MLQCPCGRTYDVDESLTGRRIRCGCGRILTVGSTEVYEPPATASTHGPSGGAGGGGTAPAAAGSGIPTKGIVAVGFVVLMILLLLKAGQSGTRRARRSGDSRPTVSVGSPREPPPDTHFERMLAEVRRLAAQTRNEAATACSSADILRPRTSEELSPFSARGYGRLTIENGTASDAVAVLVRDYDERPYRAIYIRAHERGVFTRIAEGRYRLDFQFGRNWLRQRRFCEVRGTSEFVAPLVFDERFQPDGVLYDVIEVTLNPVVGGTARTQHLPATAFKLPPP